MIYQKPTKTITAAYTTTDADNGYRIICNSATAFTITLHTATGKYNFELEIDNIGEGEITVGAQVLKQYTHAHIGNNGGLAWSVVVGGGQMTKGEIEAVLTGTITTHDHTSVTSLNSISGEVTLTAGENITIEEADSTITINSTGSGSSAYYEPITNGDSAAPELIFYNGDIIMGEVV